MSAFGQRIKQARKHAKLTQEQLARAIGMSQGSLSEAAHQLHHNQRRVFAVHNLPVARSAIFSREGLFAPFCVSEAVQREVLPYLLSIYLHTNPSGSGASSLSRANGRGLQQSTQCGHVTPDSRSGHGRYLRHPSARCCRPFPTSTASHKDRC